VQVLSPRQKSRPMPFARVPLPSLLASEQRSCLLPVKTLYLLVSARWRDRDRVDRPSMLESLPPLVGNSSVFGHCVVVDEADYLFCQIRPFPSTYLFSTRPWAFGSRHLPSSFCRMST
jgi:hypothetical protein